MNDSDIHGLSGAYAVDAVDDAERTAFEAHLAECPACRAEVASLRGAAAHISHVSVAPPPELRATVLAGITQIRPLPPQEPVEEPDERIPPAAVSAGDQPRLAEVRRFPRRLALIAAAAAAVVAGGVGGTALLGSDNESATVDTAQQVLAAPDAESVTLELAGATATIVRSESLGRAVLETEDMPLAPEGQAYQLWFSDDTGTMIDAGVMPRVEDQVVLLEGTAVGHNGVGITVEPAGGSPAPSGDPIALFEFTDG